MSFEELFTSANPEEEELDNILEQLDLKAIAKEVMESEENVTIYKRKGSRAVFIGCKPA